MQKRRNHVSKEENLQTGSSTLNENSESIPTDLIADIFSRLPAKSISRFHCLSKTCASLLCSPAFTHQFSTISSTRPRLMFTYHRSGKLFFFSAPLPQNPDQDLSVVVDNRMRIPITASTGSKDRWHIHRPVRGLVFSKEMWVTSRGGTTVCNPSTGQLVTLPEAKTRSTIRMRTFLGYDPIKNEFKVLCVSYGNSYDTIEYQVLTLGTEVLSWRMIECSINKLPGCGGICIDGVLHYTSYQNDMFPTVCTVACFDVSSEKFKSMEINVTSSLTLINYKGKLGAIQFSSDGFFSGKNKSLELMVLDDAEKHIWSKKTYIVPPLLKDLVVDTRLHVIGMTGDGEIVFSPFIMSDPFYIFYYNLERNIIVRVRIHGIEFFKYQYLYIFIDYVEDITPM